MKRILTVILTVALTVGSLAGCGSGSAKSGETGAINAAMEKFEQLENGVIEVVSETIAEGDAHKDSEQQVRETITFVTRDKNKTDALYRSEMTQQGETTVTEMKMADGKIYSRADGGEWILQEGQQASGSFSPFGNRLKDGMATVKTSASDGASVYEFTMSADSLAEINKQISSNNEMMESVGTYTVDADGLLTGLKITTRLRMVNGGGDGVLKSVTDTRLIRYNQADITVE